MKLQLKNFKCFENKTFVFSDTGNTLINAPSGSGKTTIFEAIKFVFWGSRDTDLITIGKRKMEVIFDYKDYTFKRTKNPNILTIYKNEKEIENPEEFVKKHFKKFPTDFISFTPNKQLEILENISTNSNTEEIILKIKEKINDGEKLIEMHKNSIQIIQQTLKNFPAISNIEKPTLEVCDNITEEKLNFLKKTFKQKNFNLTLKQKYIKELENISIFNNCSLEDLENELKTKNNYIIEKKYLQQHINTLKNKIKLFDFTELELSEKIFEIKNNINFNTTIKEKIKYEWKKSNMKIMNLNSIKIFLKEHEHNIETNNNNNYCCPSCGCNLVINNNILKINNNYPGDINILKYILQLYQDLRPEDEFKNLNFYENILDDIKENKIIEKELKEKQKILETMTENFEENIITLTDNIIKLKTQNDLKNKINLIENVSENDILKLEEEITNSENKLTKIKLYNLQFNEWNLNEKLRNHRNLLEQDIMKEELNLNKCLNIYEKLLILKKSINIAKIQALNSLIHNINKELEFFSLNFFDDFIQIKLTNIKEIKSNSSINNKHQIDIKINYKGNVIKPQQLSSGEYARVKLAIDLSIFNFINSECPLMLDEVVANLDAELSTKILQTVNSKFTDKNIFIIAHQVVEGIFDNIIGEENF